MDCRRGSSQQEQICRCTHKKVDGHAGRSDDPTVLKQTAKRYLCFLASNCKELPGRSSLHYLWEGGGGLEDERLETLLCNQ